MFDLSRLFGRHQADVWRDEWTLAAAATLDQLAADILPRLEPIIATAGWRDGLVVPAAFVTTHIAPRVREIAEPVIAMIVDRANAALREIAEQQATWHDRPVAASPDRGVEGWADVALAAAPIGGATALAIALPGAAVTTGTAWLGLVAVTTVSWPVAIGGGAIVAGALALGAHNALGLPDKARARLRRRAHDHVIATLIEGTPKHPSVRDQLVTLFADTAQAAKRR